MTVRCKIGGCPYWENGFCARGSVVIDENGMCSGIWRKGQQRVFDLPINRGRYPHHSNVTIDVDEDDLK